MNDPSNMSFVTYAWLAGTGLAVIAIVIPVVIAFAKGKVNKEMCKLMHDNTDKVIGLIHTTLTNQGTLLQTTHDAIIRVEASLEKNGVCKQ